MTLSILLGAVPRTGQQMAAAPSNTHSDPPSRSAFSMNGMATAKTMNLAINLLKTNCAGKCQCRDDSRRRAGRGGTPTFDRYVIPILRNTEAAALTENG